MADSVAIRGTLLHCLDDPAGEAGEGAVEVLEDGLLLVRGGCIERVGEAVDLPCGESITDTANRRLLDINLDNRVDMPDAIHLLTYLFREGPEPLAGTTCRRVLGCPDVCR